MGNQEYAVIPLFCRNTETSEPGIYRLSHYCTQESGYPGQTEIVAPPGQLKPLGRRCGCQGNWESHVDVGMARLGEYDRADP